MKKNFAMRMLGNDETTLRDMYGEKVKVYFYAIVLMYSRYKFFEVRHDYTSKAFVDALDRTFKFLGGMPKTIMFGQARVMVVSGNCGNILFAEKLTSTRHTQASTFILQAHDPDTKVLIF